MEKSNAAPRTKCDFLNSLLTRGSAAMMSIVRIYLAPGKSNSRSGFPLANC